MIKNIEKTFFFHAHFKGDSFDIEERFPQSLGERSDEYKKES